MAFGLAAAVPLSAQTRLFAGGHWAALDRGSVCDAGTLSEHGATNGRVQAIAGFVFSADQGRWGQFYARLSRPVRPGSSVMLQVGNQPFLLVSNGQWAWSRSAQQQEALMAAIRANARMKVEARARDGRRFRDYYILAGAPTAIDAAAARCAGKMR